MKAVLALALCPAVAAMKLTMKLTSRQPSQPGVVDMKDRLLALQAAAGAKPTENQCRIYKTPMMCQDRPGMGEHTAAAVISTYREDIHWLNEMPWSDDLWVYVHKRDDTDTRVSSPMPALMRTEDQDRDSIALAEESQDKVKEINYKRTHPFRFINIPNKGSEGAAYLAWIIGHYDDLPEATFFLQGHRCADHAQFDMATVLPNIRLCFSPSQGYMDLNAYASNGTSNTRCRSAQELMEGAALSASITNFGDVWKNLFQEEMGRGTMPTKLCWDSFPQFAASRDAIRRHPLEFYEALHDAVSANSFTNMEFFWRALFVPGAVTLDGVPQPPPLSRKARFGKMNRDIQLSEEEESKNLTLLD